MRLPVTIATRELSEWFSSARILLVTAHILLVDGIYSTRYRPYRAIFY